jgi:hypothetical protein
MEFNRSFLQLPIRFDAERLASEVAALPASAWVPHPQGFPGNDAVQLVSVGGALTDDWAGPMAATEHLVRMPYTIALMERLGGVWGRSRLMGLGPGAVVPSHFDIHYYWRTHIRIHIPVVTNPGVRFLCGGDEVHMAPGEAWLFDSFRMHEVRNEGGEKRVHLVLDTVGSAPIWNLIKAANAGAPLPEQPWASTGAAPEQLRFETVNQPMLMSPWEIRCHIDYLLEHTATEVGQRIRDTIERFIFNWHAAWAEHGANEAAVPAYRQLIRSAREELQGSGASEVLLDNEAPLSRALDALVFSRALAPPAGQAGASPKAA